MSDRKRLTSQHRRSFGELLRRMRKAKGFRTRDAAMALGVGLRTYVDFEMGMSLPTAERLRIFAHLVDGDYAALLLGAGGLNLGLAQACADNKAVTIALDMVEDLYARVPTAFGTLTGADLMAAFDDAARRLLAGAMEKSRRRAGESDDGAPVSPRQLECLRWAQAGKSSTDIGGILGISRRTVETHIAEACFRLGVRTRIQAISHAIEIGLLSPRPP